MEIVPPLPLSDGWIEIMPEDGDVRVLYGYPPEVWVEITNMDSMPQANWVHTDGGFAPPQPSVRTTAETLAENTAARNYYLGVAGVAINDLQDKIDLDIATPEEVLPLKQWKQYRVAVNRVDMMLISPVWPTTPA